MSDQYLTVGDVADLTHIPKTTLRQWRHRNVGPPSFKLIGRVVYVESEVQAWIDARKAESSRGDAA